MKRSEFRAGAWLAFIVLQSCAHEYPYIWVHEVREETAEPTVQPGDTLTVLVKNQAQLSGDFVVRANGTYLQPLIGEIPVAGLTTAEVQKALFGRLEGVITDPVVTVSVSTPRPLSISVLGEVRNQGNFSVPFGEGVLGAIARAGGLGEFADEDAIYVLREFPKRTRIRFSYDALSRGDEKAINFKLRDRDVVVVE